MTGCAQGCPLTATPDVSPVQGASLAWNALREPVLYSEKPMSYIKIPDIQMVLMLLKALQGKGAIERDNLALDRWELQCHVVLKPASWDALSAGLGEIPCCAGVHRRAMLHSLLRPFPAAALPLQSPTCWTPFCPNKLGTVKSLIWAQEDMIPIPRMVYLSPAMELWGWPLTGSLCCLWGIQSCHTCQVCKPRELHSDLLWASLCHCSPPVAFQGLLKMLLQDHLLAALQSCIEVL